MLATSQVTDPRSNAIRFAASGALVMAPFGAANDHVLRSLESRATTILAERDEEIVAQDEKATYCWLVVSGCVRTVQLMEDGRRQVGEFLFAGDLFGWDALDTHDFSAEAVSPVTLRRFARRDVDALADRDWAWRGGCGTCRPRGAGPSAITWFCWAARRRRNELPASCCG